MTPDRSITDPRAITGRSSTAEPRPGSAPEVPAAGQSAPADRSQTLTPARRHALMLVGSLAENPRARPGEHGLMTSLVTETLQRGLEVELAAHLGHGRWESSGRGADNIRNGVYAKRVLTDLGPLRVQMPRDRRGTFEPVIVPKHGRRLPVSAANIAALYASGMTRAEIRNQINQVTQSRLDRETVDALTDELEPQVRAWQRRRFAGSYPVLLIDSITLSTRGVRATRRSIDVAVAVDSYGDFELLGLWRRAGRAQASVSAALIFEELNYRGISAVEFICCSVAEEMAAAAAQIWPHAKVRAGVEGLVENSLRSV